MKKFIALFLITVLNQSLFAKTRPVNYQLLAKCKSNQIKPSFTLEVYTNKEEQSKGIIIQKNNNDKNILVSETKVDWSEEYPRVTENTFNLTVTIDDDDYSIGKVDFNESVVEVKCENWASRQ